MDVSPQFLLVTCQVGAERAVRGELARRWPQFRFAYSRPGFLTFKLSADHGLSEELPLESVFARACAFSLGSVHGSDAESLARGVWQLALGRSPDRLHVWPRDRAAPGEDDFEPGITPESQQIRTTILKCCPAGTGALEKQGPAQAGELVLDCVLVGPQEWWVGYHRVAGFASRFPGGFCQLELPYEAVSRAWLKMEEALRWSGLPIRPGQRCVEIGCAPGGSSQALLKHGLRVTGIDPAMVHPAVLGHPQFVHVRKRGAEVRRREFRKTRWLFADMNVAPSYTLDTVEAIVTHREVHVSGLLLTLKLLDWKLAEQVPDYLDRVGRWGFNHVRARQLQYNRQEFCVAALKV